MRGEAPPPEPKVEMSKSKLKFKSAVFKTVENNAVKLKTSDGFLNLDLSSF